MYKLKECKQWGNEGKGHFFLYSITLVKMLLIRLVEDFDYQIKKRDTLYYSFILYNCVYKINNDTLTACE
jgi:hypothetical protein